MKDKGEFRPLQGPDELRSTLIPKAEFVREVRAAVADARGFAAGKIGYSEQWLLYAARRGGVETPRQRLALSVLRREHALRRSAIFPATPEIHARYAEVLSQRIEELDFLGLGLHHLSAPLETLLVNTYEWRPRRIHFRDQEPDRSLPTNPKACYLDSLAGRRLLLVCPFAEVLRARATAEVFERVWAKSGKRWVAPSRIDAVEFPWGVEPKTWERFGTVFDLLAAIEDEIAAKDFDIALIAAAGMGIPLAVSIKRMGKCAIALGGHLQALFGVIGRRWRELDEWQRNYINEWWIDLPEHLRPQGPDTYCDNDYW